MKLIFKTLFGSHLYGLNTPQSDKDYKGIALPNSQEIIFQKVFRTQNDTTKTKDRIKNDNTDVECEVFSLNYFIKLCSEGQLVTLDMLFSNRELWVQSSSMWEFIVENRHKLIHKKTAPIIGYVFQQAAKYGVKGSRVHAAKSISEYLQPFVDKRSTTGAKLRLFDVYEDLQKEFAANEYINFIKTLTPGADGHMKEVDTLEVCNKKQHIGVTVEQAYNCFNKIYVEYGQRAKLAAKNESIDWKACSHALRVSSQAIELFETGQITFPLINKDLLLKIKLGEVPFKQVEELIEQDVERVKIAAANSSLPETIDQNFWDSFIYTTYRGIVLRNE